MPGPADGPQCVGEWCIIEVPAEKQLFKETGFCNTLEKKLSSDD